MNIRLADIEDYFKDLAISHVLLKHEFNARKSFYTLAQKESSALPTNAASPRLSVSDYGGDYSGSSLSSIKKLNVSIQVHTKAASQSEADKETAYATSEGILDDIHAKLCKDVNDDPCHFLQAIDFNNIHFNRLPMQGQNEYGYEMTFPLTTDGPSYNSNKWS